MACCALADSTLPMGRCRENVDDVAGWVSGTGRQGWNTQVALLASVIQEALPVEAVAIAAAGQTPEALMPLVLGRAAVQISMTLAPVLEQRRSCLALEPHHGESVGPS